MDRQNSDARPALGSVEAPDEAEAPPAERGRIRLGRRWLILALIFFIYSIANADRTTISVAGPLISDELSLSAVQMGLIFSAFGWAYGLFAVPAGLVVDKIGARLSLIAGILIWSVGTFVNGFAGSVAQAFAFIMIARFVIGAAEAAVTPGSARVLATWFPDRERGRASSIWASSTYVTTAIAAPVMGWLCHIYGWPIIFWGMGTIGLLAAAVWMATYRAPVNDPRLAAGELAYLEQGGAIVNEVEAADPIAGTSHRSLGKIVRDVAFLLSKPQLLVIFFGQYCGTSLALFLLVWMPTYLVDAHNMTIVEAGGFMGLAGIAGGVAAVSGGFATDFIYRITGSLALSRKASLTLGFSLTSLVVFLNSAESTPALAMLLALLFLGKGWCNTGWMLVADFAPRKLVGTVGGLLNAIGALGATVTSLVVGYLVDHTGNYDLALGYVALHGALPVALYWIVLRNVERLASPDAG